MRTSRRSSASREISLERSIGHVVARAVPLRVADAAARGVRALALAFAVARATAVAHGAVDDRAALRAVGAVDVVAAVADGANVPVAVAGTLEADAVGVG